ncbi:hypothetical protein AX16_004703 [Volvariella volvacea WC 439]|nr:hypothetical protein AX16_004703 [Volvariella volvacea WC 439]
MLAIILFGFLLSRRYRQQGPEEGNVGETIQPTQETAEKNLTENNARDRGESTDEDLVLDDGAVLNDNETIRQVDEAGRRNEHEQETREEPQSDAGGGGAEPSAEEAQRLPLYRRLKAAIGRRFAKDKPEDITPTYRSLPTVSGILIPFSVFFGIPGVTNSWYLRIENHQVVQTRPNPPIIEVVLAFSIVCAILANLCLIVRFMERRVKSMTWTCTAFLAVHDIINTTVVVAFGVAHRLDDCFKFGRAFRMTVCSTVVSIITNAALLLDIFRTPNFATSGSGLTRRQRALVIVVIFLIFDLTIGALIARVLMDLTFLDALYFTIVTIEGIGFGDIAPNNTGARVFVCIYIVFGILNFGLAVSLIRETVLESLEIGSRMRVQRLRRRRHISRWRRHVAYRWKHAVQWRLREKGQLLWVRDPSGDVSWRTWFKPWNVIKRKWPWLIGSERLWGYNVDEREIGLNYEHPRGMCLNLDALSKTEIRAAAMETGVDLALLLPRGYWEHRFVQGRDIYSDTLEVQNGAIDRVSGNPDTPLTHAVMGGMIRALGNFALAVDKSLMDAQRDRALPSIQNNLPMDTQSLERQYESFRETVEREEKHAFYTRFAFAWVLFIVFWMVGSAIFMKTEKWTFGIAMYFCFISFTTIGYGDFSPVTPAGRGMFVLWALLGVATMTTLISIISEAYSSRYKYIMHSGVYNQVAKRYRAQIHEAPIQAKPTQILCRTKQESEKNPLSLATTITPLPETVETEKRQDLSDEQEETRRRTDAELPHEALSQARILDLKSNGNGSKILREGAVQAVDEDMSTVCQERVGLEERDKRKTGRALANKFLGENMRQERVQKEQNAPPVPESLDKLLTEISGIEGLSNRAKETLERDGAQNTRIAQSIRGEALGRLNVVADEALQLLTDQNALTKLKGEKRDQGEDE